MSDLVRYSAAKRKEVTEEKSERIIMQLEMFMSIRDARRRGEASKATYDEIRECFRKELAEALFEITN